MSKPFIIGLTGGIGAGKSAVCDKFMQHAVPIVDADIAAREVVALGSEGLREVVNYFGTEVLAADGTLDRLKLRQTVFSDDSKLQALEGILHPRIRDEINQALAEITAPYCILCVPLLIEKGGYEQVDRILVIDCSVETQIARVMARDNLTRSQVEAIIETQAPRALRLEKADDVVENSGDLAALDAQVALLHERYMAIATRSGHEK